MTKISRIPRLSRRRFLGGVAGGGAAVALGGGAGIGRLSDALAARSAPAFLQGGSLTYWGGLIFSDAANQLLTDTINEWGTANNITTDVVMINQNETNQKVSAAVESGTMPDALDLGLDLLLLLSNTSQLTALDDVYDKIGAAHGGWYESIDAAASATMLGGARNGIPFGSSGNLLFSRKDVLEPAGFTPPPQTWQEVSDWSAKAQTPPVFGMGFSLSNVGDGNLQMSVLQSYGGRIADDAGTTVTIKSEATRAYLEWVTAAYKAGLFPPGATTWDGAGDNTAYLSGQAIFIANTGSVYLAAKEDDPELEAGTSYSSLPSGPTGRISPISPNFRAVPKTTRDLEAAKALMEHLANPTFMEAYYNVAIYAPVLKAYETFAVFTDPVHAGLLDLVKTGTAPGAPDVYNTAFADFSANFIVPKMIQRVVIDNKTLDEAMDEAQTQGQLIYDKYK